jgi:hypothetical protein
MKLVPKKAFLLSLLSSGAFAQTLCPSHVPTANLGGQLMHVCGKSEAGARDTRDHLVIPSAGTGVLAALEALQTADFVQTIGEMVDGSKLRAEKKNIESILDLFEGDPESAKRLLDVKLFRFQSVGTGKVFESFLPLKVDSKVVFPLTAKRPLDLQPNELWDGSFVAFELVFDDDALSTRISKALNLPLGLVVFRPAEFVKSIPGASTLIRLNQMRTQGASDKPFVPLSAFDLGFHRVRQLDNVLLLDIIGGHLTAIRAHYEFKVADSPAFKQAPTIAKVLASRIDHASTFEDGFLFARELGVAGVSNDAALAMILDRVKEFPRRVAAPTAAEISFVAERAELLSIDPVVAKPGAQVRHLVIESAVK